MCRAVVIMSSGALSHHLLEAPSPESTQLVAIVFCQLDGIRMGVDSSRDARLAQDVEHRMWRAVGPVAGVVLVLAGKLVSWVLCAMGWCVSIGWRARAGGRGRRALAAHKGNKQKVVAQPLVPKPDLNLGHPSRV